MFSFTHSIPEIKTAWKRKFLLWLLNVLIVADPYLNDGVLDAWQDAYKTSTLARERVSEFFRVLVGEPAMMLRVTFRTYKKSLRLYGVAIRQTWGMIVHLTIK